jgi:hypothetical protein
MTAPDPALPTEPPLAGTDTETMLGSLDRQRATLAWKTGGLDVAGMRATVGASTLTLGGLLMHLAVVEEATFSWMLMGRAPGPPWSPETYAADPGWEWALAAEHTPDELRTIWRTAVAHSRETVAEALADGGLDRPAEFTDDDGRSPSLRRLLADLIEEYARHVGHADLIRESVDGLVGEDPPQP